MKQIEEIDYEKLRLDVLQKLIDERSIDYKPSKREKETKRIIIELLKLDDSEKYIRETTYEKSNNGFNVGIDVRNVKQFVEIGKLVEKKEAKNLHRYENNRIFFWSPQKLLS